MKDKVCERMIKESFGEHDNLPHVAVSFIVNDKTACIGANGKFNFEEGDVFTQFDLNVYHNEQRSFFMDLENMPGGKKIMEDAQARGGYNYCAEIAGLGILFRDGILKKGDSVTISVAGMREVCMFCMEDIASMATAIELKFVLVIDSLAGIILYWRPGMTELEACGTLKK